MAHKRHLIQKLNDVIVLSQLLQRGQVRLPDAESLPFPGDRKPLEFYRELRNEMAQRGVGGGGRERLAARAGGN